jgi:hypothetical protein
VWNAAGQAAHAASYAVKTVEAGAVSHAAAAAEIERDWQRRRLPEQLRVAVPG